MNFEQRARKASQRDDPVRAAVLLIEGLKRSPTHRRSALDLLCAIYVEDLTAPGLEADLCLILAAQPDAHDRFEVLLGGLYAAEKTSMGRELVREAQLLGIDLQWPPALAAVDATMPQDLTATSADEIADALDDPSGAHASIHTSISEFEDALPAPTDGASSDGVSRDDALTDDLPTDGAEPERAATAGGQAARGEDAEREGARAARKSPGRKSSARPALASAGRWRRVALGAVVVGVVLALAWSGWFATRSVASVSAVDAQIERSDPGVAGATEAIFSAMSSDPAPPLQERRAFMRAVAAAEWGEESAASATTQTAWGMAARAASLASKANFEEAVSTATRLEREHPASLPAIWARGFVAESRGQLAQAMTDYLAGQKAYPQFVPMLSGQFRIALRQGRADEMRRLQQEIAQLSPDSLVGQAPISLPTLDDLQRVAAPTKEVGADEQVEPGAKGEPDVKAEPEAKDESVAKAASGDLAADEQPPAAQPRLVRALGHLAAGAQALQAQDWPRASREVEAALALEPGAAPTLLLAGALRAAGLQVDAADAAWAELSQIPGLSLDYRWMLQVAAPRSLAAAGRPDLAFQYIAQVRALGKIDPRELTEREKQQRTRAEQAQKSRKSGKDEEIRVVFPLPAARVPMLSVEEKAKTDPAARQALLVRAEVLSLLGFSRAADESLGLLGGIDEIRAARNLAGVQLAIRRGSERDARAMAARIPQDSFDGHAAQALVAFYAGQYEQAVQSARKARAQLDAQVSDVALQTALRAQVLSLVALGRGRDAIALMDDTPASLLQVAEMRALRMRLLANHAPPAKPQSLTTNADFAAFSALNPTSVELLIDLANTAFASKDFARAASFAQQALPYGSAHPGVHWIMGLLAEIQAHPDAESLSGRSAREHFRAAWRPDSADPRLLIEMGQIYLSLGESRRAQKAFYRALLGDRSSLAALQGLGQSYMGYSRAIGVRDLTRILGGYHNANAYLAQRLRALKWLAILKGSREGNPAGLAELEQAVGLIGESAELLVELARYHQAREEFDTARKLYARALQKDATLAEASLGLARMALKAGDHSLAISQLRRYLRSSPTGAEAQWAQQTLDNLNDDGKKKLSAATD